MFKIIKLAATISLSLTLSVGAEEKPPALLHMKDMTWLDIRGAVNCGFTTIIVPTGGIEQNGPQMALAKHDYIVGYAAEKIALEIGNTLVAPIISFVPQGDYAPPTGNMKFPGTIGVEVQTFELLLDNVARSLKNAGFKHIIFIGDHGQSQPSQAKIAARLSTEWRTDNVKVSHNSSYYDDKSQYKMLQDKGENMKTIGVHAGLIDTSELMFVNSPSVKISQLQELKGDLSTLGASGQPQKATLELGKTLLDMRIQAAVNEIKAVK